MNKQSNSKVLLGNSLAVLSKDRIAPTYNGSVDKDCAIVSYTPSVPSQPNRLQSKRLPTHIRQSIWRLNQSKRYYMVAQLKQFEQTQSKTVSTKRLPTFKHKVNEV